ncbi:MAG: hypothetical protein JWP52_3878 [Rhizobacter sp.]|nr:hypothetical protein [Rhizobacter sp.]
MTITADYLGMPLELNDRETYNVEYFGWCASHEFRLQSCNHCGLHRYPPSPSCPWCTHPKWTWKAVEGRGTVHSYIEVHHAVQPAFKGHTPYLVLLVELDFQSGQPSEFEALRIMGNLTLASGELAPPDAVKEVGIGSRVKMVFTDVAAGLSLPQWVLDDEAEQPVAPWRYPE